MPPRIPRAVKSLPRSSWLPIDKFSRQLCPICSFSRNRPRPSARQSTKPQQLNYQRIDRRRLTSAHISAAPERREILSPRVQLQEALKALQKDAANFVNISRLQLALRGLQQPEGEETIRVAILGLRDGGVSLRKAKQLARLLIADPLKPEEEWERTLLEEDDGSRPILLRVGHDGAEESAYSNRMVQEINVSSPAFNGHKLEILVLETDLPQTTIGEGSSILEALLVPTMEIPVSRTGRYTPITTPVHKSLVVGSGILGAVSVFSIATDGNIVGKDILHTTVDIKLDPSSDTNVPFQNLDIDLAIAALDLFRVSIDNALDYEHKWFDSGAPEILEWMRSGTSSMEGEMKPPLRLLIQSMLETTSLAIEEEKARRLSVALASRVAHTKLEPLMKGFSKWSEEAHTELREHLDIAFEGRRWRKLGWWKLFWRVDDVSMIATDILTRRFLTEAEQDLIFFAGRLEEAGVSKRLTTRTQQSPLLSPDDRMNPQSLRVKDLVKVEDEIRNMKDQNWPQDIPSARSYLALGTVPALQALAQKLVLQTLTTSSFVSGLAALTYISTLSTGLYEAGAVAALGIVYSMRRMQVKWENAREFWEGEVREAGRKCVRNVESEVAEMLKKSASRVEASMDAELDMAENKAREVELVLKACK
ncbi:hypothetical protein GLAREA_06498 [Glarea lozoyensis ATCC 20868]|uniref:Mmc1 C-terminal domain-containing protein n=1 Tax=Glarea lozoyensis (strain ATCC 20868 / MF5171) TaxID=1116229 RepID=S3D6S6_GLAL2|nr:uncharacterized protein GLAREA_06498 [Glarea lozoyensis ATCC 20868]EPE33485.1 hypothetical protein GLAREA_06498 [Glarea lozoyensis ATCC 20868]